MENGDGSLNQKMRRRNETGNPAVILGMALFGMYVISGILLLLLALGLYKLELSEMAVKICIIVIYIIVGFAGGFFIGKSRKTRKYLWGLLLGSLYFGLLVIFSMFLNQTFVFNFEKLFTTGIFCIASTVTGGMLS